METTTLSKRQQRMPAKKARIAALNKAHLEADPSEAIKYVKGVLTQPGPLENRRSRRMKSSPTAIRARALKAAHEEMQDAKIARRKKIEAGEPVMPAKAFKDLLEQLKDLRLKMAATMTLGEPNPLHTGEAFYGKKKWARRQK